MVTSARSRRVVRSVRREVRAARCAVDAARRAVRCATSAAASPAAVKYTTFIKFNVSFNPESDIVLQVVHRHFRPESFVGKGDDEEEECHAV